MTRKIIYSALIGILLIFIILVIVSSNLVITHYEYKSEKVPESFDGFKIVHLSDIHCKSFGKDNSKLISEINSLEPDLILITGDNVDKAHPDITPLKQLFEGICDTAPIYSISGNHECDNPDRYAQLLSLYQKYNITDLDDKEIIFSIGEDSIVLKGLGAFQNKMMWDKNFMVNTHEEKLTILLDHYPQLNELAHYGYDMLLCGHIHGGIIRLPYIGGIINNNGTLFPEYDAGPYKLWKTTMYVNRGLGDTVFPRINNNPEIVCITLKRDTN